MTAEITLRAELDRTLIRAKGGSVRYLVATVTAQAPVNTGSVRRPPINLALAIDASGSMSAGKLEAAKIAALSALDRLTAHDRLTVVSFASDIIVHIDALPMDDAGRRFAEAALQQLETRDTTNLSGGWFAAADAAATVAERHEEMTPRVVILSDGHANEGVVSVPALSRHATELRKRGVITSTVGIGDGYDEILLAAMAENGGGRLHDAEHLKEIKDVLLGEIGESMAIAVNDVELTITLPLGVRAEALGMTAGHDRAGQDWAGQITLQLGGLSAGGGRTAVVRLTCPLGQPADELAMRIFATGRCNATIAPLQTGPLDCRLTYVPDSDNKAQPRNLGPTIAVASAWQAHVVKQSARLNRDAPAAVAQTYLDHEIAAFAHYVRDVPGGADMLDALEMIRSLAGQRWATRTRKEMVLQSSKSLRAEMDYRGAARESWHSALLSEKRR